MSEEFSDLLSDGEVLPTDEVLLVVTEGVGAGEGWETLFRGSRTPFAVRRFWAVDGFKSDMQIPPEKRTFVQNTSSCGIVRNSGIFEFSTGLFSCGFSSKTIATRLFLSNTSNS